ncbi:MAG: T9SS type A sorting domain-containing protein [Candidatus Falkowbacteria bacterium]|nr:T9SS type A sorting domain-containing protein [Candidatus Falkowbacteria bacterium]
MRKSVIIAIMFLALIFSSRLSAQSLEVKFSCNNQFELYNDTAFNCGGWFCNTNLIAFHDFSVGNITKWVWSFEGSTNYDTIVMTPANYQQHQWVYYPASTSGVYHVTLTVFAFDSATNYEYANSVCVEIHLGFANLVVENPGAELNWNDSLTLKVHGNNGPGDFVWYLDSALLGQTSCSDSSQLIVSQPGIYMVKYYSPSGCEAYDYIYVNYVWPTGSFCSMFGTGDSTHLGGGYFCNQDSITFYDMSWLYSTGEIYHWVWRVKDANDATVLQQFVFDQTNYQPSITVHFPDSSAIYRVELFVSSYYGPTSGSNVGISLRFADVTVNSSDISIVEGDSVNLTAYTNYGPGNFTWSKDDVFLGLTLNSDSTTLSVSDSGSYVVYYHVYGCKAWDTTHVKFIIPLAPPIAQTSVNSDLIFNQDAYLCGSNSLIIHNHSTGINITKSIYLVQTQAGIDTIVFNAPNALADLSFSWPFGINAIYQIELQVFNFDSAYNTEQMSSLIIKAHLGFADIVIDSPVVLLVPGNSVILNAYTNYGPGYFRWSDWNANVLSLDSNVNLSHLSVSDTGNYEVTYSNNEQLCGAVAHIQVIYDLSTSISEIITDKKMDVYPNPATSQFTVDSPNSKIEIYSATGQIVYSNFSDNQSLLINAGDWTPGFYFVRATAATGQTNTKKLVKL